MYTLKIQNDKGEVVELTHSKDYTITQITGLDPAKANINTVQSATLDGSKFNSSRVNQRNIVVYATIERDAEANRQNLYRHIRVKKSCRVFFENNSRNVYIDGYVESIECDAFNNKQIAQISIICPRPYFIDVETSVLKFSQTIPRFEFPFAISDIGVPISDVLYSQAFNAINKGDVETGMIAEIRARGYVLNPSIRNTETGEFFRVDMAMNAGDVLRIDTNKAQKSVTLTHGGAVQNVINYRNKLSRWLQLESGSTLLVCEASSGAANIDCTVSYNANYEGV